jgi:hypothetical protein
MQLVDSKLYIANAPTLDVRSLGVPTFDVPFDVPMSGVECRHLAGGRRGVQPHGNLISLLKATSASARLLALMVAALILAASPALLSTIRSTVSLSLQILLQVGHFGSIALEIFGR